MSQAADIAAAEAAVREALARRIEAQLATRGCEMYRPYPKQQEFHALGASKRERAFMAGNQLGKTVSGANEGAIHATGRYPDWWQGRRFDGPTVGWASGITAESTRDNPQRLLMGRINAWGTGAVPRRDIIDIRRATGIKDAIDIVIVRHVSGGESQIMFKNYAQGRPKWQGETVSWVWFDEEPPLDIYAEGVTRTNATGGITWGTFTPLLGVSSVVKQFYPQPDTPDRGLTMMTIDDAEHYTAEERARIVAAYPAHEREARARGIPMLGSGRIFPVAEELITVEPFALPAHWKRIAGMDFGWDHPTACAWLAWDTDADVIYLHDEYRLSQAVTAVHASTIKARGSWIPVAWPHDGLQHDKRAGEPLATLYRKEGVNMRPERAQFEGERGSSVEAGITEMLDRMQGGRWKVFSTCKDWLGEFRVYHRKDGKVVKEFDDLLSASRYALMDLRYATNSKGNAFTRKITWPEPSGGLSPWT